MSEFPKNRVIPPSYNDIHDDEINIDTEFSDIFDECADLWVSLPNEQENLAPLLTEYDSAKEDDKDMIMVRICRALFFGNVENRVLERIKQKDRTFKQQLIRTAMVLAHSYDEEHNTSTATYYHGNKEHVFSLLYRFAKPEDEYAFLVETCQLLNWTIPSLVYTLDQNATVSNAYYSALPAGVAVGNTGGGKVPKKTSANTKGTHGSRNTTKGASCGQKGAKTKGRASTGGQRK